MLHFAILFLTLRVVWRFGEELREGAGPWAAATFAWAPVLMISVASLRFTHNGKPNRHGIHDVGLAAANLTVQATVTDDITGAIADSFNYMIGELRGIIASVQRTTEEVNTSAGQVQTTAEVLARGSEERVAVEQVLAAQDAEINRVVDRQQALLEPHRRHPLRRPLPHRTPRAEEGRTRWR